jgi:regulator of protease activity HflC (stomatin/prohibitin superfamily)
MADISRLPGLRHLRGTPAAHVRHVRRGAPAHVGVGLSFWFRPLTAVLSEIPVDDRELPLLFHARTADFQDVTVQATVAYRIADPTLAAARLDFSIDPDTGHWHGTPLDQLAGLLTEAAQQPALELLAAGSLAETLAGGVGPVRGRVAAGLAADPRLAGTGVAVLGVRVVAVRPEPEMERALQTPTREQVQQEADRATYQRRALAVERERAIAENELANQIELARREEQLVAQRGVNARRQAEEVAAADLIETEGRSARELRLAEVRAVNTRAQGGAQASAEADRLAVYQHADQRTLLALAATELAGKLPEIGNLTITTDLVSGLLSRLAAGAP